VDEVHRSGVVESAEYGPQGTAVAALVPAALAGRLRPLRVDAFLEEAMAEEERAGLSGGGGEGGSGGEEGDGGWVAAEEDEYYV
jgi:hypothetical protein